MQEFWIEILSFTVLQSVLSAFLSVVIGGGLAWFLYRYKGLRLERPLKAIGGLTFVMPVMIPSLAFLLLFEGVYGLWAIVNVHVFLNAIYCMNQLHGAYESSISVQKERQTQLLRFGLWGRLRYIEWPALSPTLSTSFLVVFCLCLSSFSVVLLLGGGPATTTLSVALYHSLGVSFNPEAAGFCLILQVFISLLFALLLHKKRTHLRRSLFLQKKTDDLGWRSSFCWGFSWSIVFLCFVFWKPLRPL